MMIMITLESERFLLLRFVRYLDSFKRLAGYYFQYDASFCARPSVMKVSCESFLLFQACFPKAWRKCSGKYAI